MAKTFVSNIIIDLSSIWASIYTLKCLKTGWGGLFTSTHCCRLVSLESQWKVAQIFACPNTAVDFKDRNWIPKTVHCISCLVVCKIVFCSEFPDILDNARRKTGRRRRRTQAIAKRYAFHANAMTVIFQYFPVFVWRK